MVNFTPWPVYTHERTRVPITLEVGWGPEHVLGEKNLFPPPGFDFQTVYT